MTLLHVRTHWTDTPSGGQSILPAPAWAATYPGSVPTVPLTGGQGPTWPAFPVGPATPYEVWVPLVRLDDLAASGWAAGPNWAGSPPPGWHASSGLPPNTYDEGYGPNANGFKVTHLRLFQDGSPGVDHTYRVTAPNGVTIGTVAAAGPPEPVDALRRSHHRQRSPARREDRRSRLIQPLRLRRSTCR